MMSFLSRKTPSVIADSHFRQLLHTEPALVEYTSDVLPEFIPAVPRHRFEIEASRYTFFVPDFNPGVHKTAVIIHCPNQTLCVSQVDGFETITSYIDQNERRYVIRQSPGFLPHNFSFTLAASVPIPVDVTFSYHTLSPELLKWLEKFPHYVAPFAQAEAICDTVVVVSTILTGHD
jgi:hypothetical protein